MRTHNYTRRGRGHDFVFRPIGDGIKANISGWGFGLKVGDYLILPNGCTTTRYQIDEVKYYNDPADMWNAKVTFAPRAIGEEL